MNHLDMSSSEEDRWLCEHRELVDQALNDYRQSVEHSQRLGLRSLPRGLRIVIWALRLYVLFMVAVVLMNLLENLH